MIFTGVQENSYASVSNHLVLIMGKKILSSNEISEQVKEHAHKYTQELIASYVRTQIVIPFARALSEGIYDKNVKEIGYFDDGIVVKKQKEKRNENYIKKEKWISTDVIEMEKPDGTFDYITAGYGVDDWDLNTALSCWVSKNYDNSDLPIVVITDGARSIRKRLWEVFGKYVTIILDWWHLQKKVKEYMSMIGFTKEQKKIDINFISALLWKGEVKKVIEYLKTMDAKNKEKKEEFLNYLLKHENEIINYKKRKEAKKSIGSGRAEKGVDLVVHKDRKINLLHGLLMEAMRLVLSDLCILIERKKHLNKIHTKNYSNDYFSRK